MVLRLTLTLNVSVQRHHARSLGTAKGRVMQVVRQGGGHPRLGVALGRSAVLGCVLFVSCSAVLKPDL